MEAELKKQFEDVAKGIKHVQEKTDALEKKHDALDFANREDVADAASKNLELIQELKTQIDAEHLTEKLFAIEKAVTGFSQSDAAETPEEHKQAFYAYLRKGTPIPQDTIALYCEKVTAKALVHANKEKVAEYQKALVEGSNADGGFFVTPERSTDIITRIFETSPIRQYANVISTTSSSIEIPLDDDEAGAAATPDEVTTRAVTDTPEVGIITIPIHEYSAMPKASQRMLDDAGFDIEGWLAGKVSRKISRQQNTSSVLGTGSNVAKGFLTYDAWTTAGTYQRDAIEMRTSTVTGAGNIEADDLIDLQTDLLEDYQAGAIFAMRRKTFAYIMKLKDGAGHYLMNFTEMMKEGTSKVLLGNPISLWSDMPALAAGSKSVAYGNFGEGYTIADRFGIRVLRDPYTDKPFIRYYTTSRGGGAVTNFEALKVLIADT